MGPQERELRRQKERSDPAGGRLRLLAGSPLEPAGNRTFAGLQQRLRRVPRGDGG